MEANRTCPYCNQPFVPSPFRPQQRICSSVECQRRRRTDYHRQKRRTDPDYRQDCLDSQKKWRTAHPDYPAHYRKSHPESVERNRQAQRRRDQKRRMVDLVKNNLALDVKRVPGEVWLMGPELEDLAKNNLAFSQVLIFQTVGTEATPPEAS